MDADARRSLARLIRGTRVAALGTLRRGAPNVSMVAYMPARDFATVWMRLSRLAWHTQDLAVDKRVSLSISETDDGRADPQTLARVTLRGEAAQGEEAQLLNYLNATGLRVGLLINFGDPGRLDWKRMVR